MALAFVLDEHLRGLLWRALQSHNALGIEPLDVTRVGDPTDLPLGSLDPQILLWAERENRVLISRAVSTMFGCLANHLQSGHTNPGVFMVRRRCSVPQLIDFLVEAAYRSAPASWRSRVEYVP